MKFHCYLNNSNYKVNTFLCLGEFKKTMTEPFASQLGLGPITKRCLPITRGPWATSLT